jgi:hypothetical protein
MIGNSGFENDIKHTLYQIVVAWFIIGWHKTCKWSC